MKNKKAAMEMSMGTIVTIILLVVVLVLGIFFIQRIFGTGTDAIDQIDTQVQNEINKLFTEEGKRVVVYPNSREITIKQGDSGGFGFSIKNVESYTADFTYEVEVLEIAQNCELSTTQAENLIILGKQSNSALTLTSGNFLQNAILVKFDISETTPLCKLRYLLSVDKRVDGQTSSYEQVSVDLEIK